MRVREWLRVSCPGPLDGVELDDPLGDRNIVTEDTPSAGAVTLPVRPGRQARVLFRLPQGPRSLWVLWGGRGGAPRISFDPSRAEKLRCTANTRAGACCFRTFSATTFHAATCDARYRTVCAADADCGEKGRCGPAPSSSPSAQPALRLCVP